MSQSHEGKDKYQRQLQEDAGVSKAMATTRTLEERYPLLLIHGMLHLMGHDHESDEEWAVMTKREEEVMEKFYKMNKNSDSNSNSVESSTAHTCITGNEPTAGSSNPL
jgi:hypothetical protein